MDFQTLDKHEYVSFDIFDTLIKRNVAIPSDVFRLVELKYNKLFPSNQISDFYTQRVNAERIANLQSTTEDITLDDIYTQLEGVYTLEILQQLKKIEIQMELEVCVANKEIMPFYQYCVKNKKNILIISDMYLSKEIITAILERNGITVYNKLYVSSSFGLKKSTGSLFKFVLNDMNINSKQLIHIGDNKKSDYLRPKLLGIQSILIPNHINHLHYYNENGLPSEDVFAYKTIGAFINNHLNGEKYFKIGYETLGPLLYGFTTWLLKDLKKNGIKRIFFLSRDGYLVKKSFDILNDSDIEGRYFYASRRAWIVPSLWMNPELEDVIKLFSTVKRMSVKSFLERVSLKPYKYKDALKGYNLNLETIILRDGKLTDGNFSEFYSTVKEEIIEQSKKEYQDVISYIEQEFFVGKVAIFDIGWKGSIQKAMLKIINHHNFSTNIFGYYLGLRRVEQNMNMKGFLFHPGQNDDIKYKETLCNAFMETFFTADHGSLENYRNENGKIVPILLPHEFLSKEEGSIDEMHIVKEIQKGAIKFVMDFSNTETSKYINVSPYWTIHNLFNMGLSPRKDEVELFGDFRYSDFNNYYFAKPNTLFFYIKNPQRLIIDFINSVWRIGFLKRLFKIPLPYYRIYNWVYKNKKKRNNNIQ